MVIKAHPRRVAGEVFLGDSCFRRERPEASEPECGQEEGKIQPVLSTADGRFLALACQRAEQGAQHSSG